MRPRAALRAVTAAAVVAAAPLATLVASPAHAVARDDGDEPGPPLSLGATLLLFVAVPALLYAIITLAVYVPSIVRGGSRQRVGWWASPEWIGGAAAREEALARGGRTTDGGGASARW